MEPQAPLCSDRAVAGSSSSAERDGLCRHSPLLSPSVHDTARTEPKHSTFDACHGQLGNTDLLLPTCKPALL